MIGKNGSFRAVCNRATILSKNKDKKNKSIDWLVHACVCFALIVWFCFLFSRSRSCHSKYPSRIDRFESNFYSVGYSTHALCLQQRPSFPDNYRNIRLSWLVGPNTLFQKSRYCSRRCWLLGNSSRVMNPKCLHDCTQHLPWELKEASEHLSNAFLTHCCRLTC
jgi:hypothetical protein